MRPFRNTKIASVIQAELSFIFARDCDFQGTLVTVIEVEIGEDLLKAKIKIGILPYKDGPAVFDYLQKKRREIQHKLLKRTRLRRVPSLQFLIAAKKEYENKSNDGLVAKW